MKSSDFLTVPQPKTYGPLGNLPQVDKEAPILSMMKLAEELGPIYKLALPGGTQLFISGHDLVADACDERRFDKKIGLALSKVRAFGGDGLFTAATAEPNWQKAHRILLSTFSQRAMRGYHDMMADIAVQLIQKWSRTNPYEAIDVPDDMTRLTLDTIGLCGFNYRFNSFYREQMHPFVTSMLRALNEAMNQIQRLPIQDKMMFLTKKQFHQDIDDMFVLVDKLIAERRARGNEGIDDLLSHMLEGRDPETGESLDDENIRYQIITFLIAGHETTSGLLSFALYFLLNHPDKLEKAYEEVDRILTDPVPTYEQVRELKYVRMVLSETLRLWPTAPAFELSPKEDTVLAGKYPLKKGESMTVLIPNLHRDKEVWGEEPEAFEPERFADPSQIPFHAYKPFGNGQRACIGQQFAMQEATLVLGMVLKHFYFVRDEDYVLRIKEALTLKPEGFTLKVRPRSRMATAAILGSEEAAVKAERVKRTAPRRKTHGTPLLVLYGSNLGTAEGIARELADAAKYQGFRPEIASMNDYAGKLPKEGAVFIVSASYNGKPPSNAKDFMDWLESAEPGEIAGVRFAVFGCGDHNWASTYQDVPRRADELLASKGGQRLAGRGEGDASGEFEKQLDDWREALWPDVMKALGLELAEISEKEKSSLSLQFVSGFAGTPLAESYDAVHALIVGNTELHHEGSGRSTRRIEVKLPEGVTYRVGDHLGVLPRNSRESVERVLRRFGLQGSDHLILSGSGRSAAHLPLDRPVSLDDLLGHSVDLQEAATRAQLRELAGCTACPPHKRELEALLEEDAYREQVWKKRVSMLDLLEKYEACELGFERFLELLPPLKPRYYSVSSAPQVQPEEASITVGVVKGPAWSGRGEYRGVASNYLAERREGDAIVMFVRTPESGFGLPDYPKTPVIMVGPGTGVAPFRGFLQARSAMRREGTELGEAHLYFGCRCESDYIYREELEGYEREGVVKLHTAYSREEGTPKTYVQHLMKENAAELIALLEQGGRLYVCGDGSRMAPGVEEEIRQAYANIRQVRSNEARKWLYGLQTEGRYAKDVWAGIYSVEAQPEFAVK
ncbi:bifunctional cytochrome P450/NADPH--P450 reductase [Paenibacillus chitinolyticus]|uniref:bifunctional cytochrome P450/NADPH--P450 reductase n=1 Tax=Paenibacillus chitinolyticus TaxID=79263 RepID=UPI003669ABCA